MVAHRSGLVATRRPSASKIRRHEVLQPGRVHGSTVGCISVSAPNDAGRSCAVAFADLAGYTALTEAHGDIGAADVADRFTQITESVLVGDARIVKTIGDAVMIVGSEADEGVRIGL